MNGAGFSRAVVVYVSRRVPRTVLSESAALPSSVDVDGVRVEVDVVQAGPFTQPCTSPASAPPKWNKHRPPVGDRRHVRLSRPGLTDEEYRVGEELLRLAGGAIGKKPCEGARNAGRQ